MSYSTLLRVCAATILAFVATQMADGQENGQKQNQTGELPDLLVKKAAGLEPKELEKLMESTQQFGIWALVFGGVLILLVAWLITNKHLSETSAVRLFSLIFLATLAVFLIVGGYSQVQTGSAMTLLGTLAGYIFGRSEKSPENPASPPAVTTAPPASR